MTEILENLKKAVIEYDREAAASWARKALEEGIDPIEALDALTGGIRQVGDGYGRGELWLPELVGAAEAMKHAVPIIEDEIKRRGEKRETAGIIVIGTVKGDIHDIGKNIVATLLAIDGFGIIDLGVDVAAEKFIEAVVKHNPDILAMSALLTMTAPEQRKVIDALKKEGIRDKVRVMVGGGAITQGFADDIGANGYGPTAVGAVELARRLTGK
jgi:corrinoid protein of di/trimethylamine methyltransferase